MNTDKHYNFMKNRLDQRLYAQPIAYQPWIARSLGSIPATVLLCQLLFWQRTKDKELNPALKISLNDGWVWKTEEEWQIELGLGRDQVKRAIKKLIEAKLIEIKHERLIHKRSFRIVIEALIQFERNEIKEQENALLSSENGSHDNETGKTDGGKSGNHTSFIEQRIHTENIYADPVAEAPEPPFLNPPSTDETTPPPTDEIMNIQTLSKEEGVEKTTEGAPTDIRTLSLEESFSTSARPPVALAPPFDQKEYVAKMLEDNRSHVRLIGLVFHWTNLYFPSKGAAEVAIRQNVKAASEIVKSEWSDDIVQDALSWMMQQPFYIENPPNCATIQKELPKQIARNSNRQSK